METDREIAGLEGNGQGTAEQETTGQEEAESRKDFIRREYEFAPDVKLKECRYCRVMIPKKAKVCPNCRMSLKRHWFRNTVAAVFAVAVIGGGGCYLSEHWGIMKDAVASVWMAQDGSAVPVMSMSAADNTKTGTGTAVMEPAKVIDTAEEDSSEAGGSAGTGTADSGRQEALSEEAARAVSEDQTGDAADPADSQQTNAGQEKRKEPAADVAGKPADSQQIGAGQENKDVPAADAGKAAGQNTEEEAAEEQHANAGNLNTERPGDETDVDTDAIATAKDPASAKGMDKQEQEFRADCMAVGYKSLLRDTETYLETALMVEVQVVCQVNGGLFDDNTYYLCEMVEGNNITRYYIVRDDRETDDTLILEGDILIVFGKLFGTCKIPADLIETRPTVPAVSMLYYDLSDE